MIGLRSLEVYNFLFIINTTNSKFELYTDTSDEFSFDEFKDRIEEILSISDITPSHLQHEIIGPRIIEAYKKVKFERLSNDGNLILLLGYVRSPFRDYESYLRFIVGLDEEDIHLVLKQFNSNFVTFELCAGIYTIENRSEAVYTMGDHEETLKIEHDDITFKTKLSLKRFGGTFGTLRFDEESLFVALYGFTPFWEYKPTNAVHEDSAVVYTKDKNSNLSTIDKIPLICDCKNGISLDGCRQLFLYSFVLVKPNSYSVFCELKQYTPKKILS